MKQDGHKKNGDLTLKLGKPATGSKEYLFKHTVHKSVVGV